MKKLLVSWIGNHDLKAIDQSTTGPVLAALEHAKSIGRPFDNVYLLCNYPKKDAEKYVSWLNKKVPQAKIEAEHISLSSPTAYEEIYPAALKQLKLLSKRFPDHRYSVHLSPGTPAMTAVWVLLVKTQFPAACIESWLSKDNIQHVRQVELPFKIDAQFQKSQKKIRDQSLSKIDADLGSFASIIGNSEVMKQQVEKANRVAVRDVPVLILGETGTGKEVFARAIHNNSNRKNKQFVPVNCGAMPHDLAESLLFGHKKGAFSGAHADHDGFFAQADGGTLFLDEVGELPQLLQTKLLRALQEKKFTPLGDSKERSSDFRLISATHRKLAQLINSGEFREDLFYRLAIGILQLPPLSARGDDIKLLADLTLSSVNKELADQDSFQRRFFTDEAYQFIEAQPWPGNIRELNACIFRATLWSEQAALSAEDLKVSMINRETKPDMMPEILSEPMDLRSVMGEVAKHHLQLALQTTNGNKLAAAKLLGLNSSQVLDKWFEKYF
ncbi:sigma-54 interaction domain-containing protein [Pelagibaculum spongiae]|uniref:AAA family ATPase n=1 Tax=Pelagibaculum spongiae TaxID=2080658 RepID=A0A2V1GW03_9GAMM|nr:sigma 54-interacting transcriptional regulator [Pelagibaculum spongiae]PVZ64500.1 AAA family ATPase [Pelagibaculum spongiae]